MAPKFYDEIKKKITSTENKIHSLRTQEMKIIKYLDNKFRKKVFGISKTKKAQLVSELTKINANIQREYARLAICNYKIKSVNNNEKSLKSDSKQGSVMIDEMLFDLKIDSNIGSMYMYSKEELVETLYSLNTNIRLINPLLDLISEYSYETKYCLCYNGFVYETKYRLCYNGIIKNSTPLLQNSIRYKNYSIEYRDGIIFVYDIFTHEYTDHYTLKNVMDVYDGFVIMNDIIYLNGYILYQYHRFQYEIGSKIEIVFNEIKNNDMKNNKIFHFKEYEKLKTFKITNFIFPTNHSYRKSLEREFKEYHEEIIDLIEAKINPLLSKITYVVSEIKPVFSGNKIIANGPCIVTSRNSRKYLCGSFVVDGERNYVVEYDLLNGRITKCDRIDCILVNNSNTKHPIIFDGEYIEVPGANMISTDIYKKSVI
jgi:hypothetical protein